MIPTPSIVKAVFWMALSIASFLGMTVAGRETTDVLNVFEVLELRSVIGLIILMPLVLMGGGFPPCAPLARGCTSGATSSIIPDRRHGSMR